MRDGIIKADGTSRLLRADLPATYEELRTQAAAGTQPLDVLFNSVGWSQLPTFLNKANLLKDTTAAQFGLGTDAVPDDVLAKIPGDILASYEKIMRYVDLNAGGLESVSLSTNEIALCYSGVYTATTAEAVFSLSLGKNQRIVSMGETSFTITANNLSSPYGAYSFSNDIAVNGVVLSDYHQSVRNPQFGPINFPKVFGRALTAGDELKIIHTHSNTSASGHQAQQAYFSATFNIVEGVE